MWKIGLLVFCASLVIVIAIAAIFSKPAKVSTSSESESGHAPMNLTIPQNAEQLSPTLWQSNYSTTHKLIIHLQFVQPPNVTYAGAQPDCCDHIGFTPKTNYDVKIYGAATSQYTAWINEGLADWNAVLPGQFNTPTTSSSVAPMLKNNVNEVGFGILTVNFQQPVLGLSLLYINRATGVLDEWEHCYNTVQFPLGDQPGQYSFATTARHETGHTLDLNDLTDPACSDTLMYGQLQHSTVKLVDKDTATCAGGAFVGTTSTGSSSEHVTKGKLASAVIFLFVAYVF